MISLFFIGLCFYLSYQVSVGVNREKDIFTEFGQRKVIIWLVWLVPFGLIITTFAPVYLGWLIPYLISAVCLAIVAYEARCRNAAFDTSGTSRVSKALKIMQTATLLTIVGFIYLAVSLIFISVKIGSRY